MNDKNKSSGDKTSFRDTGSVKSPFYCHYLQVYFDQE